MPELAERVLLMDDDLAVRTSLTFALELEGLTVRVYDSGAALLADPELAADIGRPELPTGLRQYPTTYGLRRAEKLRPVLALESVMFTAVRPCHA
jgi:CheY-like chemotaxis protein